MSPRARAYKRRRHHGLLLCAGGRLLSRDHDVPVLDASAVGDSEQGVEDKGLTSERAFGAQVREPTLGDDLSNAVVRQGDSPLGEGGECRTRPITPSAKRGLCCTYVSLPGGHRVPRCRRRQECSAPRRGRSSGSQRCPRCGRWPSPVDLCVAVGRLRDPWLFVCPVLENSLVLNTPQVEPDRGRAVVIGYQ